MYKEFHLDEAWDSPHNKALIAKMPVTYRCPSEGDDLASQGKTRYLAPRGKATIFPGGETVKLRDVTDGTSNTIMVVDAGDANAVVWTKPDDWEVDPEPNTAGVFKSHTGRRLELRVRRRLRAFRKRTDQTRDSRALMSRNGGEVVMQTPIERRQVRTSGPPPARITKNCKMGTAARPSASGPGNSHPRAP